MRVLRSLMVPILSYRVFANESRVATIGGLKVITAHGWFAARPSGTEEVYKLYAESFRGSEHLKRVQEEAQALISGALAEVMG